MGIDPFKMTLWLESLAFKCYSAALNLVNTYSVVDTSTINNSLIWTTNQSLKYLYFQVNFESFLDTLMVATS